MESGVGIWGDGRWRVRMVLMDRWLFVYLRYLFLFSVPFFLLLLLSDLISYSYSSSSFLPFFLSFFSFLVFFSHPPSFPLFSFH